MILWEKGERFIFYPFSTYDFVPLRCNFIKKSVTFIVDSDKLRIFADELLTIDSKWQSSKRVQK